MPVVQISRIQHRRGLSTDLPQPNLAEGELGFTLDTGELFVGAPNFPPIVGRGNYPYQNLRILTEFSLRDLLSTLLYVYRHQDRNDPAFPGIGSYEANPAVTVERFLQERLDEIVSVKSYGATADGATDDYQSIERACVDLYTDSYKEANPRILYFPAGVYVIKENALPMFAGTRWVGDGKGRTIIYLDNGSLSVGDAGYIRSVAETAQWESGVIRRNADITDGIVQNVFVSGITFARSNVSDVVRLDRTNQGMFLDVEFRTATLNNGVLENNNNWVSGLVPGFWPASTRYDASQHGVCVRIDRLSRLLPGLGAGGEWIAEGFNFIDCRFKSNTYGFYAVDAIDNINVIGGIFDDLFKGVTLGEAIYYDTPQLNLIGDFAFSLPFDKDLPETYLDWDPTGNVDSPGPWGPSGFRVLNSTFKNILDTPYSVYSNRYGNVTSGNNYYRYGGVWSGSGPVPINRTPDSPGVYFFREPANFTGPSGDINVYLAQNNSSVGDTFDYNGPQTDRRVFSPSIKNLVNNVQDAISSPGGLVTGIMHQTPMGPEGTTLSFSSTPDLPTGISFDPAEINSIVIDYSLVRADGMKKGEIHIITDSTNVDWYETIIEVGGTPVDISFDVQIDTGPTLVVKYTDDTGGTNTSNATLHWSARYWDHSFTDYGSSTP